MVCEPQKVEIEIFYFKKMQQFFRERQFLCRTQWRNWNCCVNVFGEPYVDVEMDFRRVSRRGFREHHGVQLKVSYESHPRNCHGPKSPQ